MAVYRKNHRLLPIAVSRSSGRRAGFTLAEMLVVLCLLTVIGTLAWSTYSGTLTDAKRTVLLQQIASIQIFQEDMRLRSGRYAEGVYDRTDPANPVLTLPLDWQPRNGREVAYVVTADETSYTVLARHKDGLEVSRTFP